MSPVLTGLVVIAALACPLHMWWMQRRGKEAACCPARRSALPDDVVELRRRRQEIEAQLGELDGAQPATVAPLRR